MSLKDAIGKDTFGIEEDQYTDKDLQEMSAENLETLKMRIHNTISGIELKIKEKKIDYNNGGEGSTTDWYVKHRYALSINKHALTYVNSLLKKRRRTGRTISDCFMDRAKAVLPREIYTEILNNAYLEITATQEITNTSKGEGYVKQVT